MRKMKLAWAGIVGALVVSLAACRSSKEAAITDSPSGNDGVVEWVDKMAVSGLKDGTVTSKLNLDLVVGGKSLSVGGSCNLKRDEVIQLSLVAMGFMEVGRLEFTPQYMMMVNRFQREYVKVEYADVPYLQQAGVDFYTLQALFWSDVFVPGKKGQWEEGDFSIEKNQESTILTSGDEALLQCQFVVDVLTGLIRNTSIAVVGQSSLPRLNWTYQHFANVEQRSFPDKMQLTVTGAGKDLKAVFALGNLKWNAKEVELTPEPGGRYKRVSPDMILKQLVK